MPCTPTGCDVKPNKYAPDLTHVPSFFNESVVELLYSRKNNSRAIIARNSQANFHVFVEHWDISDWEYTSRGFWIPEGGGKTITDTLETARILAREKLKGTPDGLE